MRAILKVIGAIVVICAIALALRNILQDRPIPRGIVAYRAHDLKGKLHTHCACAHKGFYILTDQFVLWYVAGHDSLGPKGEIVNSSGNHITVQSLEEPIGDEILAPFTIHKRESSLYIVEPASEYQPESNYSLVKTFLGPEVREMVENFDYAEWQASSGTNVNNWPEG